MNTTHMPGPWKVEPPILRSMSYSITAPYDHNGQKGRLLIAHIDNVGGFLGDSKANAELIASAPKLLDACKTVYARINSTNINTPLKDMVDTWNILKEVLAEAAVR